MTALFDVNNVNSKKQKRKCGIFRQNQQQREEDSSIVLPRPSAIADVAPLFHIDCFRCSHHQYHAVTKFILGVTSPSPLFRGASTATSCLDDDDNAAARGVVLVRPRRTLDRPSARW